MDFEFATAGRIVFGCGSAGRVGEFAGAFGERVFVVTGSDADRYGEVIGTLGGSVGGSYSVCGEPSVDVLREAVESARHAVCDVVVGIGGGSVIDTAKAVGALLTNGGDVMEYLEVVGEGKPLVNAGAACIAVPTTAGTGAEVTRNSVLYVPDKKVKVSMRSGYMLPRVAVVDPELTRLMPREVTASTGLDALTQLIEPYVSHLANPLTDGICVEGLKRAVRSLGRAYRDGEDMAAREDMAVASLFGGLAHANAKLGAVHGFAGPLGGMICAPHGVICARLLPGVIRANIEAFLERDPENAAVDRYAGVARIMTGDESAGALDAVEWVDGLCRELCVESLAEYGLGGDLIDIAVGKAKCSSSMKGNPIVLGDEELRGVLLSGI